MPIGFHCHVHITHCPPPNKTGALAEYGSVARYCYQHSPVPLLLFPSLSAQAEAAALAARHCPAATAAAAATETAGAIATEDAAAAQPQPYVPGLNAHMDTAAGGAAAADAAAATPASSDAEYVWEPSVQQPAQLQPQPAEAEARARSVAAAAAGAAVSGAAAAAAAAMQALVAAWRLGTGVDRGRVEAEVLDAAVEEAVEEALDDDEVAAGLQELVEAAVQVGVRVGGSVLGCSTDSRREVAVRRMRGSTCCVSFFGRVVLCVPDCAQRVTNAHTRALTL